MLVPQVVVIVRGVEPPTGADGYRRATAAACHPVRAAGPRRAEEPPGIPG